MARSKLSSNRLGLGRYVNLYWQNKHVVWLWGMVALAFLCGGSSRDDVIGLAILRPVAVLLAGLSWWGMPKLTRTQRATIGMFAAAFAITTLQLVPLPPEMWWRLPGHELIMEIDRNAGQTDFWRPMSIAPVQTANALLSMFVPLAIILAGFRLTLVDQRRIIYMLIFIAAATAMLGIAQVLNPTNPVFQPYSLMTVGAPNGLFSNRNHQALFLAMLVPILAVYLSRHDNERVVPVYRYVVAGIVALVALILLVISGSRAGLIALILGMVSIPLLYRAGHPFKALGRRGSWIAISVMGLIVMALGVLMASGRGTSVQRIILSRVADESRLDFIVPTVTGAGDYFPFGSGIGTFNQAYRIIEPDRLLNAEYLNHAHNEYLETLMTGGLPASALLVFAAILFCRLAYSLFSERAVKDSQRYGRLGAILLVLIALGSAVDYPMRTPAMMVVAAIALLWMIGRGDPDDRVLHKRAPSPKPLD